MSIKVSMQKDVTILKDISSNRTEVYTVRYKDLKDCLKDESEITATYCYGKRKARVKTLQKLGYSLKETIWFNDEELYSDIREVWSR